MDIAWNLTRKPREGGSQEYLRVQFVEAQQRLEYKAEIGSARPRAVRRYDGGAKE